MRSWAIAVLLMACACDVFDNDGPPSGEYVTVAITDGSLLVSVGTCGSVDLEAIQYHANTAIAQMRMVWQDAYPSAVITVISMPVVISVNPTYSGGQANGVYHQAERWIELRCGMESVVRAELHHALGHRLGVPCWKVIGLHHGYNLDCSVASG